MIFRRATIEDIPCMHVIRLSVQENILSDQGCITANDYQVFITDKGAGWVCAIADKIVGFLIVDLKENNVWALFVHPHYQAMKIGKQLHDLMLNYYFQHTSKTIWLSTDPNTRAEAFYRKNGWQQRGYYNNEVKFEHTLDSWQAIKSEY